MPPFTRLTIWLSAISCIAIVAYWTIWFFVDRSILASLDTESYYTFENAFPAADGWLALGCALTVWALATRRSSALLWLVVSGSAGIYLGLMDVLFDVQNGVYAAPDTGAVITEAIINVFSLGFGVWSLWFGWRHRRTWLSLA